MPRRPLGRRSLPGLPLGCGYPAGAAGGTLRDPLLLILHVGYGWLAFGLLLLGTDRLCQIFPASAALHALTVGAVGTMTLAVMTRASLDHTGRPLSAGPITKAIYALITIAAVLRISIPLAGDQIAAALWLAAAAWSIASVCSQSSTAASWCGPGYETSS
ncbi:MAG: NnrS family protein [Alphaproteobacteria bacterium]|nr:NnrS family protein [Alphaproteobacteria bacterium]